MKRKATLIFALCASLIAGALRAVQYAMGLDAEGYTLHGALPAALSAALAGALVVGLIACVALTAEKRAPAAPLKYARQAPLTRILFGALALLAAASSVYAVVTHQSFYATRAALLALGALGWLIAAVRGEKAGLWALLPLVQLGGQTILYFWDTYKYIHVSAYSLALLGYCAELLLALMLMKELCGAEVTRSRLARSACYVLLLCTAAFPVPAVARYEAALALPALQGLAFLALAVLTLLRLCAPEKEEPAAEPQIDEELNTLLSDLPDEEEEDHD